MLTTPQYKQYYEQYNQERTSRSSLKREDLYCLKGLVIGSQSKTILDYGSGKGEQFSVDHINRTFDIEDENVTCYDIGVPEFNTLPQQTFDGVICTDVLEHIPEEQLPANLQAIFSKANKFVFIIVHTGPAALTLPNGENAHCTIKPPSWWLKLITSYNVNDIPLCILYRVPVDDDGNIINVH